MPGKVHKHKHKHKHRSTHSFYCDEGANLEWGPLAGKTNDRRRNEEQRMRRWRKSRARNKVERKRRKWTGARQRGPACQPARETGAGWIWARMAGMNCPPPDALHLHGWSLPTFESPRPAAGQCAFGEETSYWELWTQNSTCYTGHLSTAGKIQEVWLNRKFRCICLEVKRARGKVRHSCLLYQVNKH